MTILGKCRRCKCCCKKKRCNENGASQLKHIEKVFESSQDCQYCNSESLEIAVEIDGIEDENKEGVFVVELVLAGVVTGVCIFVTLLIAAAC